MSKAAYLVVDARVHDAQGIARYRALAEHAVAGFGGRYLARGGATETLEGDWVPQRLVIVAFPSMEAARRFYDSPEYRAAREARAGIADFEMLLTEGLEEAPAVGV
jgi:uncharacterized protein (DUF1330 family)